MPRKKSYLTATDGFCGAGGSSIGLKKAGVETKIALNHWKQAIETHSTNFPDADHDCTDMSACDPRRYPSTDIGVFSPECTNHSLAKGVKVVKMQMDLFNSGKLDAAAQRSRATMWDVPRFAEYHHYNIIIVENVVDARKWVMFEAWLMAMHSLDYRHRCVYINSMHAHPTPQSRDRMYVVFWKKGNPEPKLDFTPGAWCYKCSRDILAVQTWKKHDVQFGKYRQQYVYCCPACTTVVEPYYYAAFNCIDWTDRGTRIGDRAKPLSANTIKRIEYGLKKYGRQPMQIVNYSPGYAKSIMDATATMTTNDHHALLTPFLVDDKQSTGINFRVRSVSDSVNTIHTDPRVRVVMPFVFKAEHSHGEASGKVKSAADPFQTQTTRQSSSVIIPPIIIENKGTSNGRPSTEPLATQTTKDSHGLLSAPFIPVARGQSMSHGITDPLSTQSQMINHGVVTTEAWNSFIAQYYSGSHCTKHITEEIGTVSTNDRSALVSYKEPALEDCYYRMLKPHEIKLAMAFDKDYVVLGSGKDQVKQLGNAVTPPAMEWLVRQCVESLS